VPINLFSHSDQEAQMQTAILNKVAERDGQAELRTRSSNRWGQLPDHHFAGGTNIFCEGIVAQSIQSTESDAVVEWLRCGSTESTDRLNALQSLLTFDTGLSLVQAASTTTGNAIQNGRPWCRAASGTPLATVFPKTALPTSFNR